MDSKNVTSLPFPMDSYIVKSSFFEATMITTEVGVPLQDPDNLMGQVGASIAIVLIAVGILGNFQVMVLVVLCPRLHRSYNALIASLSFTDLLFNSSIMPFYADSYLHRSWRFSYEMCQFHTYFGAMLLLSSAFHIALIAVNR